MGPFDFWDIRLGAAYEGMGGPGYLLVNIGGFDGSGNFDVTNLASTSKVNDGLSHNVLVQLVSSVLTILIDGVAAGTTTQSLFMGSLPPLAVGVGICDIKNGGGPLGSVPFVGSLTNICVDSPVSPYVTSPNP